jgi:hypothetical protein
LDNSLRSELDAESITKTALKFSLKGQTTVCRLFYKILIPTSLVKEVPVLLQAKTPDKIILQRPSFLSQSYNLAVLAKTADGFEEFSNVKEEDSKLKIEPIHKSIPGRTVRLRLYSKDIEKDLSVGWNSITITKRRPGIVPEKACFCSSSLCVELREQRAPSDAQLFPDTVEASLPEKNEVKTETHIINKVCDRPYVVQHFFGFKDRNPFFEKDPTNTKPCVPLTVRYVDENSKLRPKSCLYQEIPLRPVVKEMKECILNSQINRVIQESSEIIVRNYPAEKNIVDKAPISFEVRIPSKMHDFLSKMVDSVVLKWYLLLWGKSVTGPPVAQSIIYPVTQITIMPEDIANALHTTLDSLSFEGTIQAQLFLRSNMGWHIPIRTLTLSIFKTQDYLKWAFNTQNLWKNVTKYVGEPKKLLDTITRESYEKIREVYPWVARDIDEFKAKLCFGFPNEPGSYGQEDLDCQGFRIDRNRTESLLRRTAEIIVENVGPGFLSDKNNPSISKETLLDELKNAIRLDL